MAQKMWPKSHKKSLESNTEFKSLRDIVLNTTEKTDDPNQTQHFVRKCHSECAFSSIDRKIRLFVSIVPENHRFFW